MGLEKVLVFTAIYDKKDYALPRFIEHAKNLNYPNMHHVFIDNSETLDYYNKLKKDFEGTDFEVYHVERGNNTRESLARAQNFARDLAIEGGYDYMFSLESDVFTAPDIIQRLIWSNKKVISGVYLIGDKKKGIFLPCVTLFEFHEDLGMYGTRLLGLNEVDDFMKPAIRQVAAGSFGCCLIAREVFTQIPFTYEPHLEGHSDIWFYNECFRRKILSFVDTTCVCEHDMSDWNDVKDR